MECPNDQNFLIKANVVDDTPYVLVVEQPPLNKKIIRHCVELRPRGGKICYGSSGVVGVYENLNVDHYTLTAREFDKLRGAKPVLYPYGSTNAGRFVRIYGKGSAGCSKAITESLDGLPFEEVTQKYLRDVKQTDPLRGNFQRNFGYSGGENWERRQDLSEEEFLSRHGVVYPQLDRGSTDTLIKRCFSGMSQLMRATGVPWAARGFDDSNCFSEMRGFLMEHLGMETGNVVQALTIAFNHLDDTEAIIMKHRDSKNCEVYSHVVTASKILPFNSKPVRVTIIAYMRKNCFNAFSKMRASREDYQAIKKWLVSVPAFRHPGFDVRKYFEGLQPVSTTVLVDTEDGSIISATLDVPPHANKFATYTSQGISALKAFAESHMDLADWWGLIELVAASAFSNNMSTYCAAVLSLAEDRTLTRDSLPPMGLFEALIRRANLLTGGIQCGKNSRSGPSLAKDFTNAAVSKFIRTCSEVCSESRKQKPGSLKDGALLGLLTKTGKRLSDVASGSGTFGIQNTVHLLVGVGLYRQGNLCKFAVTSVDTSNYKETLNKEAKYPCLVDYLRRTPPAKRASQMEACFESSRSALNYGIAPSDVGYVLQNEQENVKCEVSRSTSVCDAIIPGITEFYKGSEGSDGVLRCCRVSSGEGSGTYSFDQTSNYGVLTGELTPAPSQKQKSKAWLEKPPLGSFPYKSGEHGGHIKSSAEKVEAKIKDALTRKKIQVSIPWEKVVSCGLSGAVMRAFTWWPTTTPQQTRADRYRLAIQYLSEMDAFVSLVHAAIIREAKGGKTRYEREVFQEASKQAWFPGQMRRELEGCVPSRPRMQTAESIKLTGNKVPNSSAREKPTSVSNKERILPTVRFALPKRDARKSKRKRQKQRASRREKRSKVTEAPFDVAKEISPRKRAAVFPVPRIFDSDYSSSEEDGDGSLYSEDGRDESTTKAVATFPKGPGESVLTGASSDDNSTSTEEIGARSEESVEPWNRVYPQSKSDAVNQCIVDGNSAPFFRNRSMAKAVYKLGYVAEQSFLQTTANAVRRVLPEATDKFQLRKSDITFQEALVSKDNSIVDVASVTAETSALRRGSLTRRFYRVLSLAPCLAGRLSIGEADCCLVADMVAERHCGEKIAHGVEDDDSLSWYFPSKELAALFYCVVAIITCGDERSFRNLREKAKRVVKTVNQSSKGKEGLRPPRRGGRKTQIDNPDDEDEEDEDMFPSSEETEYYSVGLRTSGFGSTGYPYLVLLFRRHPQGKEEKEQLLFGISDSYCIHHYVTTGRQPSKGTKDDVLFLEPIKLVQAFHEDGGI